MIKIIKVVMVLLVATLVISCGTANSPKEVAVQFTRHLTRGEFSKAAELGTSDTKQLLSFMASMVDEKTMKNTSKIAIKHVSTEVNGDTAVVIVSAGHEEKPISLRKVNGKWLVELEKDALDMNKDILNQY